MQSEARINLGLIYKEQQKYFSEKGNYALTFDELGWRPDKLEIYSIYFSSEQLELPTEVETFVKKDKYQIVAIGNIDRDDVLDVWAINEKKELKNIIDDCNLKGA